jgi:hypothetical protein
LRLLDLGHRGITRGAGLVRAIAHTLPSDQWSSRRKRGAAETGGRRSPRDGGAVREATSTRAQAGVACYQPSRDPGDGIVVPYALDNALLRRGRRCHQRKVGPPCPSARQDIAAARDLSSFLTAGASTQQTPASASAARGTSRCGIFRRVPSAFSQRRRHAQAQRARQFAAFHHSDLGVLR